MSKKAKISLVLLSIALPLLLIGYLLVPRIPVEESPTESVNLSDLIVLCVGESNELYSQVLSKLGALGVKEIRPLSIPEATSADRNDSYIEPELLPESGDYLIIFDSLEVAERVSDEGLHRLLREAARKRIPSAAIGPSTSQFFEALKQAKVYTFYKDRNPAYFDPPLVAFKVEGAKTREGDPYYYPSIKIVSSSQDADALVSELIHWLRS